VGESDNRSFAGLRNRMKAVRPGARWREGCGRSLKMNHGGGLISAVAYRGEGRSRRQKARTMLLKTRDQGGAERLEGQGGHSRKNSAIESSGNEGRHDLRTVGLEGAVYEKGTRAFASDQVT